MSLDAITSCFAQYGAVAIFVIVLLEYMSGNMLLERYLNRFPKQRPAIERNFEMIRRRGCFGIFLGKLIPMVRTLISIPAGVLRIDFVRYSVSSALGVFLWNLVFVGAGYFLGDAVFEYFHL